MDPTKFDDLARAAAPADGAASATGGDGSGAGRLGRGAALKTLGAALLGGLLAGRALPQDTAAKPRRRKRKNRKKQRKLMPPRPAPPAPPTAAGSKLLWATVDRGGSLARGSGAISATRTADGAYRVSFKRDVEECAYVAQLPFFSAFGEAYPHRNAEEPTSVIVFTYDTSLASQGRVAANKDFHLLVTC